MKACFRRIHILLGYACDRNIEVGLLLFIVAPSTRIKERDGASPMKPSTNSLILAVPRRSKVRRISQSSFQAQLGPRSIYCTSQLSTAQDNHLFALKHLQWLLNTAPRPLLYATDNVPKCFAVLPFRCHCANGSFTYGKVLKAVLCLIVQARWRWRGQRIFCRAVG